MADHLNGVAAGLFVAFTSAQGSVQCTLAKYNQCSQCNTEDQQRTPDYSYRSRQSARRVLLRQHKAGDNRSMIALIDQDLILLAEAESIGRKLVVDLRKPRRVYGVGEYVTGSLAALDLLVDMSCRGWGSPIKSHPP